MMMNYQKKIADDVNNNLGTEFGWSSGVYLTDDDTPAPDATAVCAVPQGDREDSEEIAR
jgi:hypothetical protein